MRILATAGVAACLALPLHANVLTFDDAEQYGQYTNWIEDGFTYYYSPLYTGHRMIELTDDQVDGEEVIFTRPDGRLFSFLGADVYGSLKMHQITDDMGTTSVPLAYSFSGYRDGSLVASLTQFIDENVVVETQSWGTIFSGIDTFVAEVLYPEDRYKYAADYLNYIGINGPLMPGDIFCDEWCGTLFIDNVRFEISPVPISASLTMLLAGIGVLSLKRRLS